MSTPAPVQPGAAPLTRLIEDLARAGTPPMDALHVAAMLEMNGWTDRRAAELGFEDVFDLAETVWAALRTRMRHTAAAHLERVPWYRTAARMVLQYLQGIAFAVPVALSSLSVLALRYALWSYVDFSTEVATGIVLGTGAAFLVAGGFSQAIARRGLFYLSQQQYALARRTSVRLFAVAMAAALLVAALTALVTLLVPVLPWSILRVAGVYYLCLTVIWLGVALLYMLQLQLVVLALVAAGTGLVYLQFEILGMPMMAAQGVAMGITGAAGVLIALGWMRYLEWRADTGGRPVPPRWSQVTRSLAPYFLYGVLYFGLLFADRMVAWTLPGAFHPYFVWFLGDYELGLDWALWTLILPMGVVEIYVRYLFRRIQRDQQLFTIDRLDRFNRFLLRRHTLVQALVLMTGLLGIPLLVALMDRLARDGFLAAHPLRDPTTRFAFLVAAPAYSVLATGLQNALVLFGLNVPWPMVQAAGRALLASLAVGFPLSRYLGHGWAVLGLAAGALTFSYLSTRAVRQVFGKLDYYLMRSV